MFTILKKILLLVTFSFLMCSIHAQEANFLNKRDSSQRHNMTENVFIDIESGISSGKASAISHLFSGQTYLSLSNGVNGYFSSNQTYYILEDFFRIYKVISFKLQNIKVDENVPYATGIYYFDFRGKRGTARVYVSLNRSKNSWKISQLTIN